MNITKRSGIIANGKTLEERQVSSASIIKGGDFALVATAAHSIYNLRRKEYYDNILFSVAGDKKNVYRPIAVSIPKEFVKKTYLEYDTCFLIMEDRFNEIDDIHNMAFEVAFNLPRNLRYSIYGYTDEFNLPPVKIIGNAISDTYNNSTLQGIPCIEEDGMSGGPWITKFKDHVVQNSLSILSMNSVENVMWGPYWGEVIKHTYQAANKLQSSYPDVQLHHFDERR